MPGIGHAEHAGDGALAVQHEPMDLPQHVTHLIQVVLGGQPGARGQAVVVGAALAVDEYELDGWRRGELAEGVGDEHGLADPGQAGHNHARHLGQPHTYRLGVLRPAQPPSGQGCRGQAGQVDPCRSQERVTVQAPEPDQAGSLLLGPDADTAPGVGQTPGRLLVVGQTRPGHGGHGGGHALVVSDELRWGEAMLAGPLIPIAET